MNQVIINKRCKRQYIFSCDSIIIKKKDKVEYKIMQSGIERIIYNSKLQLKEIFDALILHGYACPPPPPNSFDIFMNGEKNKVIRLWITREELAQIKEVIAVPVEYYKPAKFC